MSAAPEAICRVRAMTPRDLQTVVALERAAYDFPWSMGIFRDCMRMGYDCLAATSLTDTLLGYCLLSVAVGEAHILNVCVAPARRRRGVATTLMNHAVQMARSKHADTIMLEVRPSNRRAVALYRQLGFVETGMRQRYYRSKAGREDALLLARHL